MSKIIDITNFKKDKEKNSSQKLTKEEEIQLLNELEKDNRECNEYSDFWEM